jgi:putative ABC transport system permease protein
MIRHCLRLVWNRKRTNLLVTLEIFFSFLVVSAVIVLASHYFGLYRQPLGFTGDDVWVVRIDTFTRDLAPSADARESTVAGMRLVDAAVREFPEVIAAARSFTSPYVSSRWIDDFERDGRRLSYDVNSATDDFDVVFRVHVVRGRWFGPEDDSAAAIEPVVVNQRFASALFGPADPIGRVIPQDVRRDGTRPADRRIVGVIEDWRRGDFEPAENYAFIRHRPAAPDSEVPQTLVIRTRPGTTAVFEERLARRLHEVARGWSFEFQRLDELRSESRMQTIGPLAAGSVVAAFLLLMVALGLTGVMWQTVTQRTREIGLRRANGAAAGTVSRQILLELTLMSSVAVGVGVLVAVQVPLLEIVGGIDRTAYATGLVISAAAIYLLTMACGWYPSRLAARVQPAEALRYE